VKKVLDNAFYLWYYVYMMKNNNISNILKWLGTGVLILGVGLNSINIYPLGPIITVLGGFLWVFVGIIWKEYSIITTNLVLSVVSIVGLMWNMGYFS
tara:strand:+ start:365 stop:655 length:291 start_codon:yes stop_codon:yes gene_type:complete